MFDIVEQIERYESLKKIYLNNLFTVKSIAQKLNLWDNLPDDEKDSIENLTPIEACLNKEQSLTSALDESTKLNYGEITQKGVETIYEFLKTKITDESGVKFCDVGSGNGKIILHLSIISKFQSLVGIEIQKFRHLYANFIAESTDIDFSNVHFINTDAVDLDYDEFNVVFMNDLLFDKSDIEKIIKKLKPNTHLLSIEENSLTPDAVLYVEVSWMELSIPINYYKIK